MVVHKAWTETQAALRTKVSKERIGIEVSKMMRKSPLHALTLIDVLDLHASIFICGADPPRHDAIITAQILQKVLEQSSGDEVLWFAAATSPFRGAVIKEKKNASAVSVVLGDGLKVSYPPLNELRLAFQ